MYDLQCYRIWRVKVMLLNTIWTVMIVQGRTYQFIMTHLFSNFGRLIHYKLYEQFFIHAALK